MATIINPITTVMLNRKELESGEYDRYPFKYILEDDGSIMYYTKLTAGRYICNSVANVPGLSTVHSAPKAKSEMQYLAHGFKIPGVMFKQVRQFFLDVMDMGPSTYEAQIFIVWNEVTKDYRIIVPKQTVSAAAVKYDIGDLLGKSDVIICDIHSHNDMGAFFSGTDDRDDKKNPWISGVFGKLSTNMEDKFRFNDGCGNHYPLTSEDVFDFGENVVTPSEWLAQVVISKPEVGKVTSWATAYGYVQGKGERFESQAEDSVLSMDTSTDEWFKSFSAEEEFYDAIIDILADCDNVECVKTLESSLALYEDPKADVGYLTSRENETVTDIIYMCSEESDSRVVVSVLTELAKKYNA